MSEMLETTTALGGIFKTSKTTAHSIVSMSTRSIVKNNPE
jgi:hypothetical protein